MVSSFTYNGVSTLDFGLIIAAPPRITAPQRDEETLDVPGSDGVLRIDHGRYKAVTKSYEISFDRKKRREVEWHARGIKAWLLSGRGDYVLSDTYDRDYFRVASFGGPLDMENVMQWGGRATIAFQCHPYKYSYSGQFRVCVGRLKTIVNAEMFESLPHIRIRGSGNCELYLNNTTIKVADVSDYVDIDSEAKQVFKGTTLMNSKTIMGDFPVFVPGENHMDWNSNVTSVEIIPRWRTL